MILSANALTVEDGNAQHFVGHYLALKKTTNKLNSVK